MIKALVLLAAIIAVATGIAMLDDARMRPDVRGWRAWARHLARLLALVAVTASGGVLMLLPSARGLSIYQGIFDLALACHLAMQSPCPWWRYVWQGRAKAQRLRPPIKGLG